MTPTHDRVTLPWAQQIWDIPVAPSRRDVLLQAFAAPTLEPDDRASPHGQDVVSLAVVLDLLATRLRKLPADATILARAAQEAVAVGVLGGAERAVVCARLAALAQSSTAQARGTFVLAFGQTMAQVIEADAENAAASAEVAPVAERASTQHTVAQALARITQATRLVVREAELLLAQRRARSSWQI